MRDEFGHVDILGELDLIRTKLKKHKHKLLIEVLDEIPSGEEHYVHNIREEIDAALSRINLKVTWLKSYRLEVRDE